jgi:ubiquinone/menaquinone biosynthesis C-methylase UbiE
MKDNHTKKGVWGFVSIPGMESEEDYFKHHLDKYALVKKVIEKKNPKTILDIGVATGIFYSLLENLSRYEIHGIDFVSNFIHVLQKRGIHAKQCNLEKEKLPYGDAIFDLIICDSIIEHTLKPKHLISEIYRALKPGGTFILVTPNATGIMRRWNYLRGRNQFWPLIDNLYSKEYLQRCSVFYAQEELKFVLEDNHLTLDEVDYLNEESHDSNTLATKIGRFLGLFIPRFRDVIFIVGSRKQ